MAKKQIDFSEALASSMDNIMNDDEYRRLFNAPKVATASKKDPVGDAVETLLLTSQLLEEMGLKKSAARTLETINMLISEAMEKDDKDEDEKEEDKSDADDDDGIEGIREGVGDGEEGAEVDVSFADDKDSDKDSDEDDKNEADDKDSDEDSDEDDKNQADDKDKDDDDADIPPST